VAKVQFDHVEGADPLGWAKENARASDLLVFPGLDAAHEALERFPAVAKSRFLVAIAAHRGALAHEERVGGLVVGRSMTYAISDSAAKRSTRRVSGAGLAAGIPTEGKAHEGCRHRPGPRGVRRWVCESPATPQLVIPRRLAALVQLEERVRKSGPHVEWARGPLRVAEARGARLKQPQPGTNPSPATSEIRASRRRCEKRSYVERHPQCQTATAEWPDGSAAEARDGDTQGRVWSIGAQWVHQ